mmetsp:Transcript_34632/g.91332  ORF Transcript_34632/g.91332 Transcript_34632/m.91332 type:complete len:732 (-) Transcript_34632:55-2250(-)
MRPPLLSLTALVGACAFAAAAGANCNGRVVVGVDYYPEQWPLEDMRADMKAIKEDLGADLIRIGEFMWHELEPENNRFNFTLLDKIIGLAEEFGLEVMLGTPTATMPAWLHSQHPEVMLKGPDSPEGYAGATPAFGGRRQYSFNSPTYLNYATRIVEKMVKRYGQKDTITFWQVDNEIGHEGSDLDFSGPSLVAWREWLETKYNSDIDKLNRDWGTTFWGVTYNHFDEIPLPRWTIPGGGKLWQENFRSNNSPGMLLDYRRFRRDSITKYTAHQVAILRDEHVKGCVTTNAPGGFWGKAMDHNDLFDMMDLAAYDNYPVWGGSTVAPDPSRVALDLDVVRGWGRLLGGGWMVAEQLIGAQGHDIIGFNPRPGQVYAWAAASMLHGATGLCFFRYRAAVYGQEEFCYGVLDHTTPRGTGRKWKEAQRVYKFAKEHEQLWVAPVEAKVALLYDNENIFAWQAQPQSLDFDFGSEAHRLYRPFWRHGATVDVISTKRVLASGSMSSGLGLFAKYRIILLPAPMLTSDGLIDVLTEFVAAGGSLWVSFRADVKDERSQMRRQPSRLAALAGADIVEIESLNPGVPESTRRVKGPDDAVPFVNVSVWREGLRVKEGTDAEALFNYTDSFFGSEGYAAATRMVMPSGGEAIYLGAGIDPEGLLQTAASSLERQHIEKAGLVENPWIERRLRRDATGNLMRVTINHAEEAVDIEGRSLAAFDVSVDRLRAAEKEELLL